MNKKTYSKIEVEYEEMKKRKKAWDNAHGICNVEQKFEPDEEFQELIDKEIRGEITTEDIIKMLTEKYKKGKYKGYYLVNDCDFDLDFSKVRKIIAVTVDGRKDYEIFFDDDKFTVILSDIVYIIDDKGIKHTDDILEFLQSVKER